MWRRRWRSGIGCRGGKWRADESECGAKSARRPSVAQPEGVRDPPHRTAGDHHHVEADAGGAVARMGGEPGFCRRQKPCALARAEGEGGFRQGGPPLDLHEGEQAFALGDQVDFAGGRACAARQHDPAFSFQRRGGHRFRIAPIRFGPFPA